MLLHKTRSENKHQEYRKDVFVQSKKLEEVHERWGYNMHKKL